MRIEIENFGPIEHLEIDLSKDLHLIYGKNGTGKSYATYLIYCLLKVLRDAATERSGRNYGEPLVRSLEQKYEQVLLAAPARIDVTDIVLPQWEEILVRFIFPEIENALRNTFGRLGNIGNRYSGKPFRVRYSVVSDVWVEFGYDSATDRLRFDPSYGAARIELEKNQDLQRCKLHVADTVYDCYLSKEALTNANAMAASYLALGGFSLNGVFRGDMIREMYFLPAGRSGLYVGLSSLSPIIAELSQHRHLVNGKSLELPSLTVPVADFFLDLARLNRTSINHTLEPVVQFLEEEILNGSVVYDSDRKQVLYLPKGTDLALELNVVSSMAAELSLLAVFLRHIVHFKGGQNPFQVFDKTQDFSVEGVLNVSQMGHILFVEEPEAHLHPEAQVKLVEFFVMLTKLGIKVFLTSHSNYMFNKLNNMLLAQEVAADQVEVYHLELTAKGSVRNPNMRVTADGVEDDNFQETSEKLYFERMKILEGGSHAG